MKVLLRRNVRKLGIIGEVVDVKAGYARNYLLPEGLAVAPSAANVKSVEKEKASYLAELAKIKSELQARATLLTGKEFTLIARANEEGNLYGSVGAAQIASAAAQVNVAIEPRDIILEEPIRHLGSFPVRVSFDDDIEASITVIVVSPLGETAPVKEEAAEAPAEEEAAEPADETPSAQ
jgi:large subunit ribosomal protein L9